jgi:hypothetical protein
MSYHNMLDISTMHRFRIASQNEMLYSLRSIIDTYYGWEGVLFSINNCTLEIIMP